MTVIARPIQAFDISVGDAVVMPTEHGGECLMVAAEIIRTGVDELLIEFEDTDIPGAPLSVSFTFADPILIEERPCRVRGCYNFVKGDSPSCGRHTI